MVDPANTYRRIALLLAAAGIAALLGTIVAYAITLHRGGVSYSPTDWGTFGDFVGGLAGTIIALATLVALAFTLHLQAKELTETRAQLQRQADSVARQVELTKQIECRKIRPLLKVEWVSRGGLALNLEMKNVGLGAAIVRRIELHAKGVCVGDFDSFGEVSRETWRGALYLVDDAFFTGRGVREQGLSDLTRALAVTEHQWIAALDFSDVVALERAKSKLESSLEPVIFFTSLAGEEFSTRNQLELPPLE